MRRLRTALAAASAATLLVIGGCGFSGAHDIPLPGGADLGDDPYTVRIHFRDVLDLVPQAGVRVGEVPVGTVEEIKLADDGWTAEVVVRGPEEERQSIGLRYSTYSRRAWVPPMRRRGRKRK